MQRTVYGMLAVLVLFTASALGFTEGTNPAFAQDNAAGAGKVEKERQFIQPVSHTAVQQTPQQAAKPNPLRNGSPATSQTAVGTAKTTAGTARTTDANPVRLAAGQAPADAFEPQPLSMQEFPNPPDSGSFLDTAFHEDAEPRAESPAKKSTAKPSNPTPARSTRPIPADATSSSDFPEPLPLSEVPPALAQNHGFDEMPLAPPAHNTSLFDADPFGDTADAPAPLTAQPAPLAEPSAFPEAPSGEVPPPLSAPPVGGNTGAPVQTFDAPQSPFAADPMPVEQAPATRQQASRQQASRQQAFPEPPQQQQPQRQPQATLFDREPFPENDFPTPAAPAATTLGQLTEEATHSPNVARNIGPTTTDMISPETTAVQLPEGTGIPGPKNIQGPQTAQVLIEKVFPEEIQVERQTTLKIRVRNVGKSTAEEVVLLDQVPQGTRLVSTSPQAQISPEGGLFWELGSIDPGKEIVAEMRIVPLREGEIGSVARVVFASSASGRSNVTRPQLKVEVRAPQQAMIGQMVNLDIVVSNPGTGTAEGVVLTEHVPEGLYNADGKKLLNKIGKLKPKETVKLTLPLKCTGSGKVANRLLVEAENTATVEENTVIDILAPKLQLNIAGAKTRYLERKAVYQLTVANPGTASAANVDLVCQLPTSMQFVSTNQSGLYEASTHTVHWALEELPAGEAGQIELVALPVKSGEHKLKFSGSGQNDLKGEAAHDVTIDGLAAVSFSVKCLSDLVEVGRDAVYEIAVVNRGTKASTNVIVGIQLSKGMSFVSAEGPAQYRADEGIVQFNPLGRIEPKSEKTYRVKARCLDDGDHRISVKLISDDLQAPITKEESTRVIK